MIDVAQTLPHGDSIRCIERIESVSDHDLVACVVQGDVLDSMCRTFSLANTLGVEIIGQAIALHAAVRPGTKKECSSIPQIGYIVRSRRVELAHQLRAQRHYIVQVRLIESAGDSLKYEGGVRDRDSEVLVTAGEFLVHIVSKLTQEKR